MIQSRDGPVTLAPSVCHGDMIRRKMSYREAWNPSGASCSGSAVSVSPISSYDFSARGNEQHLLILLLPEEQ